tara:strand:+ start:697 stop:849 length:153 start_codon:yes stop_codon:yes gene_type:complete
MDVTRATTRFLSFAGLCLALLAPPSQAEMVSIKGSVVNMRSGPGTHSEVL